MPLKILSCPPYSAILTDLRLVRVALVSRLFQRKMGRTSDFLFQKWTEKHIKICILIKIIYDILVKLRILGPIMCLLKD